MEKATDVSFCVGQLPDGRFVAASCESPYFCVRGDSEEAVVQKVTAGLEFYFNSVAATKKVERSPKAATFNAWHATRVVNYSLATAA